MTLLPDALVIGPMKGGPTWIHDYLTARGDVCLPAGVKETFFFDHRFDRGRSWYESHFNSYDSSRHWRIMDLAPSYFHSLEAPRRVREVLGPVPLFVTLRDPVRRAWSHYLHLRRYEHTRAPLRQAAEAFPELLEASRYAACLELWRVYFPSAHFHILWQEVLACDPDQYAARLCDALGLDFNGIPDEADGRSYEAAVAPISWLAALGRHASFTLRGRGLHRVVNLAGRLGLRRFFFGSPGKRSLPKLTGPDAAWLLAQLEPDFRSFARTQEIPVRLTCMPDT